LAVISDREYWEAVLGRRAEPGEVENLNRLDVQSWSHPDEATLHVLGQLGGWGARLALMSNAPRRNSGALAFVKRQLAARADRGSLSRQTLEAWIGLAAAGGETAV
jgi:hypothetical protein